MKGDKQIIVAAVIVAIAAFCRVGVAQGEAIPIVRIAEPLAIVMTGPMAGAKDVPPGSTILIQFSHPLDCMTVTASNVWVSKAGAAEPRIPGILRCEDHTIAFIPDVPLAIDAAYAVHMTSMIRGAKGERLTQDADFSFSTIKDALTVLPDPAPEGDAVDVLQ
jgi:hypothetical protein